MQLNYKDVQNVGEYTTGEVANYLGVSVQTINDWIKSGKISPARRTRGNSGQWRIPVNAKLRLRNGNVFELRDVINEKQEIIHRSKNSTHEQNLEEIETELTYFANKYLGIKNLIHKKDKSVEEIEDMEKWLYWLDRYIKEIRYGLFN